ncbi:MAG: cupin domain-containing protein [Acidobacterium ailaaui]|nr:cupin domain-containing protein [Pseudacidobacterium ailaaui]
MVASNTDDYTGTVWLNLLSMQDSLFPFSLIRAEFAPGSRLRWHMHPKGQILLILEGTGYYMEKDTTGKVFLAKVVHQGEVIKCAPGVVHTHMAAPHSSFAYIGIESDGVRWLQPVTDEEYNEISQE